MSSEPSDQQSRAIAYSHDLKHLAVSNNEGEVTIREVDWNKIDARDPEGLNNVLYTLFEDPKKKKKYEWIEAMAYSPNNDLLAVGSHDNFIYLLQTDKKYKLQGKRMTGHSSFITALDWSNDGEWMRSTCGAHELLFWHPSKGKRDPRGASGTQQDVTWCDHTAKRGWAVQGITPPGCDGTHINAVTMDSNQALIATGDDYGLVCVYRNPALKGHDYGKYRGHSEFVTNVQFAKGTDYLFSTGG